MNKKLITIVAVLVFVFLVSSVQAHAEGVSLSAFTSTPPTIDGTMSPGEWAAADTIDFSSTDVDVAHTLYVMNDANNLYLAVKRYDTTPATAADWVTFVFDNDNDGLLETGDDRISATLAVGSPAFSDQFYSGSIPVSDEGWQYEGTVDGSAAVGAQDTYTIFEISHPLNSGDFGPVDWQDPTILGPHDFALNFGDTVGFDIETYDGSYDLGDWPAHHPAVSNPDWAAGFGDIIIAPPITVVSTYPADGATNIPADVTITAVMSKSINQCVGTVVMVDSDGNPVALQDTCHIGTHYCTSDYLNLVIQPAAPLSLGETYTVTISDMESSGEVMETPYSWSFTVITPPTVISTYPTDGATNIPADVTITAVMSQHINQCLGMVTMVDSSGSPVTLLDTCHPGTYFCTDDYLNLQITPAAPLVYGETYTVTISDMEGLGGVMETPHIWSFTVIGPPEVSSTNPADGDTNVPIDVTITAVMSQHINQCVGTVTMVDSSSSSVTLLDDCHPGTYYCTGDYQNLEIQPAAPLVYGETYTVTISDMETLGVTMVSPYSWSFTVMTTSEATQDLSSTVDELGLPPDVEDGLLAKLAAAQMQIDVMKYTSAQKSLLAFIKQVQSQQEKAIPLPVAEDLIATAQGIIDSLAAK
jgi:predicted RNA-binding protein with TRAM domain